MCQIDDEWLQIRIWHERPKEPDKVRTKSNILVYNITTTSEGSDNNRPKKCGYRLEFRHGREVKTYSDIASEIRLDKSKNCRIKQIFERKKKGHLQSQQCAERW